MNVEEVEKGCANMYFGHIPLEQLSNHSGYGATSMVAQGKQKKRQLGGMYVQTQEVEQRDWP